MRDLRGGKYADTMDIARQSQLSDAHVRRILRFGSNRLTVSERGWRPSTIASTMSGARARYSLRLGRSAHRIWACSLSPPSESATCRGSLASVPIASSKRYQKRDAEICPQRQGPEPRTSCSALRHRDRAAPRTCPVFAGIGRRNHKAAQKQGTGWLGRQDSNLGMAESKSNWFARNIKVHSEKLSKFVGNHFKRLPAISECRTPRPRQLGCS